MFKTPPPVPDLVQENASDWQEYPIEDFGGGLNTAEPTSSLRPDQFTALSNYYLTDNRKLRSRGPFRPWLVSSEDTILPDSAAPLTFTIVELRGSDFRVASWDNGGNIEVSVYDESNNRWAGEGGGTSIKTDITDDTIVRFAKFSINEAEDLLFANASDIPQRWVGTVDTASVDLGLSTPEDGGVLETLVYVSHATADGGASTIITFDATVEKLMVGEHVLFVGVAGTSAATWNVSGGIAATAVSGATVTFAIAYSAGTNFGGATITHSHFVISTGAATADGRGLTLNGTYYYRFADLWDDSGASTKFGESGLNDINTPIVVTGAAVATPQKVTIKTLDIANGDDTVPIDRSTADTPDGPLRLVGALTGENVDFVDVVPNGEEGIESIADPGTPPRLKNIVVHGGRVWGIGLSSAGALTNKGVWSRSGNPDFYAALDFAYFPDPLTGPMPFRRDLYWFTEKQIYVTPNADPDTNPEPVKVCDIGCDSYDSIVDVGNGLVWQYEGNIYWANFNDFNPITGDLPWPIGEPIRDKIAAIPVAERANTTAEFHNNRAYFSFTGTNQTTNTSTLVWDVKNGSIMLSKGRSAGWTTLSWSANDINSWKGTLYTLDNANKYIMEHDFAGTADFLNKTDFDASTSQNIATQLITGDLHFGHEWAEKIINSISLLIQSVGTTYNVTLAFEGTNFQRTKEFVLGTGGIDQDATWLIWDQGTWDNFNWAGSGSTSVGTLQSDHKQILKGGKGRYARLTVETNNAGVSQIVLAKIYFKLLPRPA